jgi:hypothetical protein
MPPAASSAADGAVWLTVEQLAPLMAGGRRTLQRRVAGWYRAQWPRVRRVVGRGYPEGRFEVEQASFDAYCRGEPKPADEDLAA